jgi:hypothetical protein
VVMALRSTFPVREDCPLSPPAIPWRIDETLSDNGIEEPLRPFASPERMLLARAASAEAGGACLCYESVDIFASR